MKGSSGFSDIPKETKKIKFLSWFLIGAMLLIVGMALGRLLIPVNPLQQYIITRTCDFVSMGSFSTAVCRDGTSWTVSPFQE